MSEKNARFVAIQLDNGRRKVIKAESEWYDELKPQPYRMALIKQYVDKDEVQRETFIDHNLESFAINCNGTLEIGAIYTIKQNFGEKSWYTLTGVSRRLSEKSILNTPYGYFLVREVLERRDARGVWLNPKAAENAFFKVTAQKVNLITSENVPAEAENVE